MKANTAEPKEEIEPKRSGQMGMPVGPPGAEEDSSDRPPGTEDDI